MLFKEVIIGNFLKRYKRFLVDIEVNGKVITAYCANTGKMTDLLIEGSPCILTPLIKSEKFKYKWEAIYIDKVWVGTNTMNPNKIVEENLSLLFPGKTFRREVFITPLYKADFVSDDLLIEVKHVHWKRDDSAYFPDCITTRGTKQLKEMISSNYIPYIIYIVQRDDVNSFSIAKDVDPLYYKAFMDLKDKKLYSKAFKCNISEKGIFLKEEVEILY